MLNDEFLGFAATTQCREGSWDGRHVAPHQMAEQVSFVRHSFLNEQGCKDAQCFN